MKQKKEKNRLKEFLLGISSYHKKEIAIKQKKKKLSK